MTFGRPLHIEPALLRIWGDRDSNARVTMDIGWWACLFLDSPTEIPGCPQSRNRHSYAIWCCAPLPYALSGSSSHLSYGNLTIFQILSIFLHITILSPLFWRLIIFYSKTKHAHVDRQPSTHFLNKGMSFQEELWYHLLRWLIIVNVCLHVLS